MLLDLGSSPSSSLQPRVDGAGAAHEQRGRRLGAPAAPSASSCSAASRSGARLVTTSLDLRRGGEEPRELGRGVEQLLEVVDHEQQLAPRRSRRAPARAPAPTLLGVLERAERDEARALGELAARAGARARARSGSCRSRPGPVSVSRRTSRVGEQLGARSRGPPRGRAAASAGAAAAGAGAARRGRGGGRLRASSAGSWARIAASRRCSSRPGSSPSSSTSASRARR